MKYPFKSACLLRTVGPLVGVYFIWLMCQSDLGFSQSRLETGYLASRVEGVVLSRSPVAVQWSQVKNNQFLPVNYLLQVSVSGSLKLQLANRPLEGGGKPAPVKANASEIVLTSPMVIRLDPKMLKAVEFSKNFIEHDVPEFEKKEAQESQSLFADAWNRTTNFLGAKKEKNDEKTSSEKFSSALTLSEPGDFSFHRLEKDTVDIELGWIDQNKSQNKSYKIYAWKKGEKKSTAVGSSSATSYTMTLSEPGEYQVQVESSDGKLVSKPVTIYVDYDDLNSKQKNTASSAAENLVKLIEPRDGQTFINFATNTPVRFSWRFLSDHQEPLQLVIMQGNSIVYQEKIVESLSTSIELSPGKYTWHFARIAASFHSSAVGKDVSEAASLEVRQTTSNSLWSVVKLNLSGNEKSTFFISEW